MATWTNDDGLTVAFGTSRAAVHPGGSFADTAGGDKVIELTLEHDNLPAVSAGETLIGLYKNTYVPSGDFLKSATLTVLEAFDSAGDALTLTLGMVDEDGDTVDADGIDAAIAQGSIDAVGDTITCDGALVGTALTSTCFPSVTVGGADATAGKAVLRLVFFTPKTVV